MDCPRCGHDKTRVYKTQKGINNFRYRSCVACGHLFQTKESVYVDTLNLEYVTYMQDIGEIDKEETKSDPWEE